VHFNGWLQEVFLTQPELVTGKKYPRWKRIGLAAAALMLIVMFAVAVFGKGNADPDDQNYRPLSVNDINKYGDRVLANGDRDQSDRPKGAVASISAPIGRDEAQVISRKEKSRGEYILPAGSRVSAILDGAIDSQLAQGPVTALLQQGFAFQGRTILSAGTKILGHMGQGQDSDRLEVVFDQAVMPNGHQVSIKAAAVMPDGSPGIVGDRHTGRALQIAGALGSSFLAGTAAALETNQVNMLGISQPDNSTRNAILNGLAQTTLQQGKQFSDGAQKNRGYVTVQSGSSFQVYFEHETDFTEVYL
jgi:type IV secretory pathway VirB10-like protein